VAAARPIQREAGSKDHALEIGEADSFRVPPQTSRLVCQTSHDGTVTEYSCMRNGILVGGRTRQAGQVDDYSVRQTLKADPRTQPIPVVMLSALADVNENVRGIDLGADDYITKPFDAQEFRARIQMILRRASVW